MKKQLLTVLFSLIISSFISAQVVANQPDPLALCDVNNPGDELEAFNLEDANAQILNGQTGISLTYFSNQAGADMNDGAVEIFSPYTNTVNPQAIYVRVEDINNGGFDTTTLDLVVEQAPAAFTPTPLVEEDPDNDGFTTFNLTDKDLEITGGATGLIVNYHTTTGDADTGNNPIVNTSNYTNISNPDTVYARVESVNSNCSALVALVLLTEYAPFQVNSAALEACNDNNAIGTTVFDLTLANQDILSDLVANDYTVAYYETYDDALTVTNAITNPNSFDANPNLLTIYVGVTEIATGDSVITTINLQINELPIILFDDIYTICQGDSIDLVPYTVTQQDAIYQWNTGSTSPTLHVSQAGDYTVTITNTVTGCVNTDTTTVNIGFYPVLGTASNLTSCDPNQAYDLSIIIPEILDGLDLNQYTVTFYESTADAANQVNAIQNPSSYLPVNTNQTITASVNEVNSECSSLSFFDIISGNCPVTVICGQPVTASFCYSNNETLQYTYTSSDGTPLQLVIVSGQVENIYDELIVLDSDGVTNLNAATPYGNAGDLTNLIFEASGDTITIYVDSDASIDCPGSNYSTIDYV
ncbi:MAG: hypothetical protein QNK89_06160, partial [Lacinutrix sp.]